MLLRDGTKFIVRVAVVLVLPHACVHPPAATASNRQSTPTCTTLLGSTVKDVADPEKDTASLSASVSQSVCVIVDARFTRNCVPSVVPVPPSCCVSALHALSEAASTSKVTPIFCAVAAVSRRAVTPIFFAAVAVAPSRRRRLVSTSMLRMRTLSLLTPSALAIASPTALRNAVLALRFSVPFACTGTSNLPCTCAFTSFASIYGRGVLPIGTTVGRSAAIDEQLRSAVSR